MNRRFQPVPCYHCGGLVQNLTCTKCHKTWENIKQFLQDGCIETSERCVKIVETVGVTQEMWNMNALRERYGKELDKIEDKEWADKWKQLTANT